MAPKKLKAKSETPGEVYIPPERGAKGFKVKANKDKYDVWQKEISANVPATWTDPEDGQTKTIRWMANYGLKLKGKTANDPFEDRVDAYEIEFEDEPGSKFVYFDGQSVQLYKNPRKENGKVIVTLDLGDPNTGSAP